MIRLNDSQISAKISYIKDYMKSGNNADASKMDANANVSSKNISTLRDELNKDINIQVNREILRRKIEEMFGIELSNEYIRQLETHELYSHDETNLAPYCVSISMYPFLLDGIQSLGGQSEAPKNIYSFCGNYINLIFAVSSQFSGAVATVEFLLYFDHFAKKEWGENYIKTNSKDVYQLLQSVVYSINQPASARGYQSCFTNITLYDKLYFDSMFGNFVFPCGTKPTYNTLSKLQDFYLNFFRKENEKKLITFPVLTCAYINDGKKPVDKDFEDVMCRNLAKGSTFFKYTSESADSLASCCRLKNEISDNTFSNSMGAGGVSTGSINVITININRLIQDGRDIEDETLKVCKYQHAYRELMKDYQKSGMLPVYDAGYITLDKQFSTIGINGLIEGAESLGIEVVDSDEFEDYISKTVGKMKEVYKNYSKENGFMINLECVPAENLAVKFSKWDKLDGYETHRNVYSSYMYQPENKDLTIVDKMKLHGDRYTKYFDGGSALHLNLENIPSEAQFKTLIRSMIVNKVPYWCENIRRTKCNDCGNLYPETKYVCECGSKNVVYGQRIIGYLKWEDSYSKDRQCESQERYYH